MVWIYFKQDTLHLGPFLYYETTIKSLAESKIAKHTKPSKDGTKAERKSVRVIPKARFAKCVTIEEIYAKLFTAEPK